MTQQPPAYDFEEAVIDLIVEPTSMTDETYRGQMGRVLTALDQPLGQEWLIKAIEAILDWSLPMTEHRARMLDRAFLFAYGPARAKAKDAEQ